MTQKLVIYDSVFGNKEKIAQGIGEALGDARVKSVKEVNSSDLEDLNILIVGSPTRGFQSSNWSTW